MEQFEHKVGSRLSLSVLETRDNLRGGGGCDSLEGRTGTGAELKPCVESYSSDGEFGLDGVLDSNLSSFWEASVKSVVAVEVEVEEYCSGAICCSSYGFVKVGSVVADEFRYVLSGYSPGSPQP